jgi:hypothetical protein
MADHIQIGDATPRVQYTANGSQIAFTFLFPIFAAADMEVWLGNVKQSSSTYSISGIGISGGGSVLFNTPPANGTLITLVRRLAISRLSDYQEDGIIRAKVLNDELDYQTAAIQQVALDAGRAVKRSLISTSTADLTLPEPLANRSIKWNAAATGLENSTADVDAVIASATASAATASTQSNIAITKAGEAAISAASASNSAATATTKASEATTAAATATTQAAEASASATAAAASETACGTAAAQSAADRIVVAADKTSAAASATSAAGSAGQAATSAAATASDRAIVAALVVAAGSGAVFNLGRRQTGSASFNGGRRV